MVIYVWLRQNVFVYDSIVTLLKTIVVCIAQRVQQYHGKHNRNLSNTILFHHQISTCIENVKFQAETVVLLPGTSSGQ